MLPRLVSGIILAVLVSVGVLFLPANPLKAVVAVLVAVGAYECARMILPLHTSSSVLLPAILATAFSVLMMFGPDNLSALSMGLAIVVIATFSYYLIRRSSLESAMMQVSRTIFTVVYFGLLFSFLGRIRDLPSGAAWLFLALAATFAADTGAYFAGRLFGRTKLAARVSPGKTVEGLGGGFILSIAVCFIVKYLIYKDIFTINDCLWVGGLAGAFGPLGDLSESLIKRSVGVKDSGTIIPGHGGLLDRVDALLFTSPVIYGYIVYLR
jgi:phosphatidate cytidylyltransferase